MKKILHHQREKLCVTVLVIFFSLLSIQLFPQADYPQGYFRSPIDFTPSLSGTFAEIRSRHFHSGIDYRTHGVEGKPLYAAANGFVSRIRIAPGGFGKAIYIEHPNGFTTVYAHVRNFIPRIQQYIIAEQYRRESFDVNLYPKPNSIPVKKGEVIAWSGNSGSSSGPHLHFEIRQTHNQNPINPKLFGLKVHDDIPPVIQALKIYPANTYTSINGKYQSLVFDLNGANGKYWLSQDRPVHIAGDVAFGIQAYDTHNHSNFRNGISSMKIHIDNVIVFEYRIDEFSFSETRYVKAIVDYDEFVRTKRRFIQTRVLPNNPLDVYRVPNNGGVFSFIQNKNHLVRIEIKDTAGNRATLQFRISASQPAFSPHIELVLDPEIIFRFDQINRFQTSRFVLEMPPNTLYENLSFVFKEEGQAIETLANLFHVHDIYTPVHSRFTIAIKPQNLHENLYDKAIIVRKNVKGEWVSEGGTFKDGFITTSTRNFGVFSVMVDTIAPEISPINVNNNKNIKPLKDIRIGISDELSGIKSYRATMNNKWILMDYDPKNELLVYEIDSRTISGRNRFKLIAEDKVGNRAVYEAELIW